MGSPSRAAMVTIALMSLLTSGSDVARASTSTVTGSFSFEGTATLESVPCQGVAQCPGSFSGQAAAVLVGLGGDGTPYVAVWELAPMAVPVFSHNDQCPPFFPTLPVPPTTGTASGPFTITGGHFLQGGNGDPAVLQGGISWTMTSATLTVNLDGIAVSGRGGTVATASIGLGAVFGGVASLVPTSGSTATCASPGTMTALIAGSSIQID